MIQEVEYTPEAPTILINLIWELAYKAPPTNLIINKNWSKYLSSKIWYNRKGKIFWVVLNKINLIGSRPPTILINHIWKGNIPNFI